METKKKKIGFILNPYAGIGGKAGLKGSDNYKKIEKLLLEGCERTAPKRAESCMSKIADLTASLVAGDKGLVGEKNFSILSAPGILLNDAVTIPEMIIPQVPIIKGDAKSVSIAAASILAKVTRDRLMVEYDKVMPEYGFAGHKGYGSKEHIEAIKKYGPTPIHRKTFIKKFI